MTSALGSLRKGNVQPVFARCSRVVAGGSTLIATGRMPRASNSGSRSWKLRNSELQDGHQ